MLSGGTGTVRHMAPVVYNNEKYDLTVDVYSLGLIIYYLYTNEKPFRDYSIETIKLFFNTDLILSTEKSAQKILKVLLINVSINKPRDDIRVINYLMPGNNI